MNLVANNGNTQTAGQILHSPPPNAFPSGTHLSQDSASPMDGGPAAGALSPPPTVTPHMDSHYGNLHPTKNLKRRAVAVENHNQNSQRAAPLLRDSRHEPATSRQTTDFGLLQQYPFSFIHTNNVRGDAPAFGTLHNTAPSMPEDRRVIVTTFLRGIGSSVVMVGSTVELSWYLIRSGVRLPNSHVSALLLPWTAEY